MSDLRSTLASALDDLHPHEGEATFTGLQVLRRRRQRRQRVSAILVSAALAAGATVFVVHAFAGRDAGKGAQPAALSPRVAATIQVGVRGQTSDIVAGFGHLWVSVWGVPGGEGIDETALIEVDPTTMSVVRTVPVPAVPTWETGGGGLLATPDALWIASFTHVDGRDEGALFRVDPATGATQTYTAQGVRGFGDVASDGTYLWLVGRGRNENTVVERFDPISGTFASPVDLGGDSGRQIDAVPGAVLVRELTWVHGFGPCPSIASIDPATLTVRAENPLPADACGPDNPNRGSLFVLDGRIWTVSSGTFAPIDPLTARPEPSRPSFDEAAGPRSDPVVAPSGVWYGAYPGGNGGRPDILSRFDPATGEVEAYDIRVGWSAAAAFDGAIWAMGWDGTLTKVALDEPAAASPSG